MVHRLNVGAAVQQQLDEPQVAPPCSIEQRCGPEPTPGLKVYGGEAEEVLCHLLPVIQGSHYQSCIAVLALGIWIHSPANQGLHLVNIVQLGRLEELDSTLMDVIVHYIMLKIMIMKK